MPERFIITADPPTANGDLHVGHLSGPYLAADALARFLRLMGHDVAYYSNIDPHQTYVVTTARALGQDTEAVADRFHRRIVDTLEADSLTLDCFGTPDRRQKRFVSEFFESLYEQGKLVVRDEAMPYCRGCERFLFQAYIEGTCPHCGVPCFGNNCEACARPNSPKDMGSPVCRLCRSPATYQRKYRGLFLPLARYQERLREYLLSRRGLWRPRALDVLLPLLDEGPLPDIPVTFVSDHGLPVSIKGFSGQVFNVRLEVLPALISTFDKWRDVQNGEAWDWRSAGDVKILHCHGIDNSFQYGVMFNALLMASDLGWQLPHVDVINEFCLLDGQKFSTTRNYAVWGGDILSQVQSDPLRFYLAFVNPEHQASNFVLEDFRDTTDRLLIGPWNEIHRCLAGLSPTAWADAAATPPGGGFESRLEGLAAGLELAFAADSLSLRQAARLLAGALAELAERAAALRGRDPQGEELAVIVKGVQALAIFAEPILPDLASRLRSSLGLGKDWHAWREPLAPAAIRWREDLRLVPLAEVDLEACAWKKAS